MLQIALAGALANRLERMAATVLPTPITWTRLSEVSLGGGGTPDLVIALGTTQPRKPRSPGPAGGADPGPGRVLLAGGGRPRGHRPRGPTSLATAYGFVVGRSPPCTTPAAGRAVAHPVSTMLGMRMLLIGETGTGKERVARAIHRLGRRSTEPYFAVNCAAIPADLAGSELLGHRRGAFSGADRDRLGALRAAGRGVLFLDEVGDLADCIQGHLLRGLEEGRFTPVGADEPVEFRAQVVSATHRPLDEAVPGDIPGRPVFPARPGHPAAPGTRERKDDLPLLVRYFLGQAGLPDSAVDDLPRAWEAIHRYDWPGNLRELRRDRPAGPAVARRDPLPPRRLDPGALAGPGRGSAGAPVGLGGHPGGPPAEFDRRVLQQVLARWRGDTARAAEELGITRRSVYNLAHRLGVDLHPPEAGS